MLLTHHKFPSLFILKLLKKTTLSGGSRYFTNCAKYGVTSCCQIISIAGSKYCQRMIAIVAILKFLHQIRTFVNRPFLSRFLCICVFVFKI